VAENVPRVGNPETRESFVFPRHQLKGPLLDLVVGTAVRHFPDRPLHLIGNDHFILVIFEHRNVHLAPPTPEDLHTVSSTII
jgi:hypothetical protein